MDRMNKWQYALANWDEIVNRAIDTDDIMFTDSSYVGYSHDYGPLRMAGKYEHPSVGKMKYNFFETGRLELDHGKHIADVSPETLKRLTAHLVMMKMGL